MDTPARNAVLIIGAHRCDISPFVDRGLAPKFVQPDSVENMLQFARAVVVVDNPGKFRLAKLCLARLFPKASDHGVLQVIITHSEIDFLQISRMKTTSFPESLAEVFLLENLGRAAEYIARANVEPAAGNPAIKAPQDALSEDQELLIRRAFSDCDHVFLEVIPGGMAAAAVFKAHASLTQSDVGPLPLPFFVKFDTRKAIENERSLYARYADHYIPFNLRPNLAPDRCVRGHATAALVGNFVDDAMGLRASLRAGYGSGILFSLFESSLKRFRLQPFARQNQPMSEVLSGFIKARADIDQIPKQIVERAESLGLRSSPQQILETLMKCADGLKCYWGPYHGDLHAGNIMIRGNDAIVIDFSKAGDGPLTADPSTLEVSLCFSTDKYENFCQWRKFIDQVYGDNCANLHPSPLYDLTPHPWSWLRKSLRELRHVLVGCHEQIQEARAVLATYLLRFARLKLEQDPSGALGELALKRHSYALVIAERLSEQCRSA